MMGLAGLPLAEQGVLTLSALVLFTSFLLLAQQRVVSTIHVFAWQGALLGGTTGLVAMATGQEQLYISAGLTLVLKAMFVPWLLHRLVVRLKISDDVEAVSSTGPILMVAAALVIFSYDVALPIGQFTESVTRNTIAVSMAVVLLGLLMLITRRKAVTQVVGFMSMENGLFFAAVSATYGMPMVVELGIAFDVLVAAVIFGVFFFHIRDSIDSLDVDQLNQLSERDE